MAGIQVDATGQLAWMRLYPINFRELMPDARFSKYDVISVNCRPARQDARLESWKPDMSTLRVEGALRDWKARKPWVDRMIEDDMCSLQKHAADDVRAPSLALMRPSDISDFRVTEHPGWTPSEQSKIDAYVSQLDLFREEDRTPLEAPRFRGHYHWRCSNRSCGGHEQGIIDWEFVAYQRRMRNADDLPGALRRKFLDVLCDSRRETSFYVGNQAKRAHVFSILGVHWPPL